MSNRSYNNQPNARAPLYFDDFITRDRWRAAKRSQTLRMVPLPATNMVETLDALVIELIAPGIEPENLHLRQTERGIEVRYDARIDPSFEPLGRTQVWRNEYLPGSFRRTFDLNTRALDLEQIEVTTENGIIRLQIPKQPEFSGQLMASWPFSMN